MKDKRQRMALAWPYAMYTDPTIAATILAAASASLPSPYHGGPGIPSSHLGVAPNYPAAAAAAYYAARYSPYSVNAAAAAAGAAGLHRPHPQSAAYPPPPPPHHPHLLQPHPSLAPLHLTSLAGPPVSNGYVGTPTTQSQQTTSATPPSFRPAHLPELSPSHSDTSSDCDCNGNVHQHHNHQQIQQQQQHLLGHNINNNEKISSIKMSPVGLNLVGLPAQIQSIQGAFESKTTMSYHHINTSGNVQTKIEPPKLFQPYKTDISEKA